MGKDAAEIRKEFHARLGRIARELARELYPNGMPRGTKFSELEAVAGAGRRNGPATHRDQRAGAGRRLARGGTRGVPGLRRGGT